MKRSPMSVAILAVALLLASTGCEPPQPPQEDEPEEMAENIEEARERTGDRPEGLPGEDPDTPIEGSPKEVLAELDREIKGYQQKIEQAEKDLEDVTTAKVESARTRLKILREDLEKRGADAGAQLSSELEKRLASLKKEWNQTKRQIDMQLDEKLERD